MSAEHDHDCGDDCCELCTIAGTNWTDEPTAVTKMLHDMQAVLAEAHEAVGEQRKATVSLMTAVKKRSARQIRRSFTPKDFPAAVAGGKK